MASTQAEGADLQAIRANKLALVERLADDLAHEIKNPLHSMVINLEVLRRRIARLSDTDQGDLLRYAGVLGGELDRVTRRIDLLLRLVRPERGGELTTLGQTVEEMLDLVELERERHGVVIDFEPAQFPLRGHLRREHAWQLAMNLLLEALDSAAPGGTLTIRAELQGDRTLLRLTTPANDAAYGLEAADSPRLIAARAIAQALNGDLDVGYEGRALGFTVTLPAAPR
jgi:two-component system, sporulation sensor kinase E